jgi:DNA replication and repair protein RecF
MQEYLQVLPVVTLSAEDRALIKGEPKARREFLDGTALLARPAYLRTYQQFHRALRQRNEVLKGYNPSRRGELEAWTRTYVDLSVEVHAQRAKAARSLAGHLSDLEHEMERPESVSLEYLPEEGDLPDLLERDRDSEVRRAHTIHGPHRDAVEIRIGGMPVAAFGSSGQVRTILWMLKLSRLLLIRERDPAPPLFLLDDVESELDARRVREMMRLTEGRAQLFLTATEPLGKGWGNMRRYKVRAGEVSPGPMEM